VDLKESETLIKENQIQRRERLDKEMLQLLFKRLALQKQLEEVEKQILMQEGAISENEALRRDIGTEEALAKAKEPEKLKEV
jgi:AmiR/NasT family two-component response regulator